MSDENTLFYVIGAVVLWLLLKNATLVVGALVIWYLFKNKLEFFKHDSFPVLYEEANQPRLNDPQCKTVECALAKLDKRVRWNQEYNLQ